MPFKDKLKQLLYMRKYQAKRRVELKKQEQLQEDTVRVIKLMRDNLVGRKCMPALLLQQDAKDAPQGIILPIIHKTFELGNLESLVKAALAVVEEEDKLLLVGEHKGWPALGIHGLASIPRHSVVKSQGRWPTNMMSDVQNATETLQDNKHFPPYILIVNTLALLSIPAIPCSIQFYDSPYLCTIEGQKNNALVVAPEVVPSINNFEVVIGCDVQVSLRPDNKANLWEALTPVIHKPSSICEITNIKYS